MDEKDIPQHGSKIFAGQKKVVYATRNGHYVAGQSSGWDDESFATEQAVQAFDAQTEAAWQAYQAGTHSALYYLMWRYRHDEASLAAATGQFRWQLRRHFRVDVFAEISAKTLAKYAEAFQLTPDEIRQPRHEHTAF